MKDIEASLAAARKKAAKELAHRAKAQAKAAGNPDRCLDEDMERLNTLPRVQYKPRIKLEKFRPTQGDRVHPLNIRLPERQVLTLRYMAELNRTTMSEQVRPILDAVLRMNDNAGGTVHRKFKNAGSQLQRTT